MSLTNNGIHWGIDTLVAELRDLRLASLENRQRREQAFLLAVMSAKRKFEANFLRVGLASSTIQFFPCVKRIPRLRSKIHAKGEF